MAILEMNLREAVQHWVRGFNAIPQEFITNALDDRLYESFVEQFPDFMVCKECGREYTEEEYDDLESETNETHTCKTCESVDSFMGYHDYQTEVENQDILPMWGWMWTFEESIDEDWARDNIETLYKCGFRVYDNEDLGIVIGIDGAGYDFYEQHWTPLYKARGLRWHKEETEE